VVSFLVTIILHDLRNPFRSRFLVLCLTDRDRSRLNTNLALKFIVFVTMASGSGDRSSSNKVWLKNIRIQTLGPNAVYFVSKRT